MSEEETVTQSVIEEQYRRYVANPVAVDPAWRAWFQGLSQEELAAALGRDSVSWWAGQPARESSAAGVDAADVSSEMNAVELSWRLSRLVTAFRSRGHYYAKTDPLNLSNVERTDLELSQFGISEVDLDVPVRTDIPGWETATPRQVVEIMRRTYCGSVGWEVMQIEDPEERQWVLDRIERPAIEDAYTASDHLWMLERLTDAQEFERFLHTQYTGAKRFSLEGLDTLIPLLDHAIDSGAVQGVSDAVIGMAHRGRLNVLVNTMHKSLRDLFVAFNDTDAETMVGRGDVKYHLGYSTEHEAPTGQRVVVALCFNPSHLEFVNPVVAGRVRARMDRKGDATGRTVLPMVIHGDAAFAGQGIVMETLNLAQLEGYRNGGTLHIVLNNQVGFTTSPQDSRSGRYSSDVIRMLRVPIFHVNAQDVDAAMRVTRLAVEYRQRFMRDVCIDLVGFRRYGHNEADEPRFTQPEMYRVIDARKSIRDTFAETLVEAGEISPEQDRELMERSRSYLMAALQESRGQVHAAAPTLSEVRWRGFRGGAEPTGDYDTRVELATLQGLARALTTLPPGFKAHPKVLKLLEERARAAEPEAPLDWGSVEMLAYASLTAQGVRIRMSGQDARRGTFSHRHAYVVDVENGMRWCPINAAATGGGSFEGFDSPLSEAAVLGFEYGYSLETPAGLCVWEAQFGDFANGAQVIIDQFIASGEDKWARLTGLVLLLPHGFEGQGPEHSYARLGRFLQLCAEDNMQVCDCTTPAQFFHLLRRQVLRPWRKPLIVMTPKSLLRAKSATSTLRELASGTFHRVLPDTSGVEASRVRRVLICSGRIYYDLADEREKRSASDVHIVRLEQLYPLHPDELARVLSQYGHGTQLVWVQDEPWNLGAWSFVKMRFQAIFGDQLPLHCVSRAESACPATGSSAAHRLERAMLMEAAFAALPSQQDLVGS